LVAVASHVCQYLLLRCGHLCGCREGRAGGYKEFDEAEIEETKRRRKELEEVGGLSYQIHATIFQHKLWPMDCYEDCSGGSESCFSLFGHHVWLLSSNVL
jgi:hypothetical protein